MIFFLPIRMATAENINRLHSAIRSLQLMEIYEYDLGKAGNLTQAINVLIVVRDKMIEDREKRLERMLVEAERGGEGR